MMACVTEAKGRLTDTVNALPLDVEVTESGEAGRVKLRDSYPARARWRRASVMRSKT